MNLNKFKSYKIISKLHLLYLALALIVICWFLFVLYFPNDHNNERKTEVFIASPTRALSKVKTYFPKSDVYKIGDEYKYTFYVVDSSGLKRVCCNHLYDDEISSIELMIKK